MAVLVEHSIRSAVELDDAVELADLPNFVQVITSSLWWLIDTVFLQSNEISVMLAAP